MKIALITLNGPIKYSSANNFSESDDLLPFLQSKGLDIYAEAWDDETVNWKDYEVIVLKTPWDYHLKLEAFVQWLNLINSLKIRLLNEYNTIMWNMDKHYLNDILSSGLPTIPTVFLEKNWKGDIEILFDKINSDKLIIKPTVSGGSKDTVILDRFKNKNIAEEISALTQKGDFMLQPFIEQVSEGEWSLMFFNGEYSHTVIKKPKSGDFRVQQIFGGSILVPNEVGPEVIRAASEYVEKFAPNSFYARVDGLILSNQFVLMELELIEPFLYLSYHPDAAERYYQALSKKIKD